MDDPSQPLVAPTVQQRHPAAAVGALTVAVGDRYALEDIAKTHARLDAGDHGRVLVTVP
ncbi:hypothetical protein OG978_03840 [Streptomyces sp. NBC_01591]|uniref:hypothetical protein n=1 Tax=Streptomyces sp. NBC_01591 TaxID=2975888 RepID=UPI002DDC4E7C|nr:hypothetical protein [Streptomyces sp. NBC_01591]WSD66585.1 hypothetical protein OG978_03840 [Streptomyces sp. NBC_01591]